MMVDSVMRREVVTIPPSATAREAARLISRSRLGSLIVAEGGRPVGIITERDLVSRVLAAGLDADATLVRAVMSTPIATIEPAASVEDAARRMLELGIKRLVVVLGEELRGIVTTTDLAYATPRLTQGYVDGWVKSRWQD